MVYSSLIPCISGLHQREVFLFNDILVITKILKRKKNTVTYEFRQSHMLAGLSVSTFENQFYPYGIKISPGQKNWENVLNKGRSSASGNTGLSGSGDRANSRPDEPMGFSTKNK